MLDTFKRESFFLYYLRIHLRVLLFKYADINNTLIVVILASQKRYVSLRSSTFMVVRSCWNNMPQAHNILFVNFYSSAYRSMY